MSRLLAFEADRAEAAGEMVRVESSNLYAVYFQPDFQRLFVWFGGNEKQPTLTRYCYEGVGDKVYAALLSAPSKGKFLDQKLKKGGYAYTGPF